IAVFVGYEDSLRVWSEGDAIWVVDRAYSADCLQGCHIDSGNFVFSGNRGVDSAQFRNCPNAMNTGKAVEVRYDDPFFGVEYHKLIGVHVGDVQPPLLRIKALIVEADC